MFARFALGGSMSTFLVIVLVVLGLIGLVILWAILIYNRLVAKRQRTEEGWSGIDVQLKRRSNLIPNLIETVKGYAAHEKETLDRVTAMRARADRAPADAPAERAKAESALSGALVQLFAVAENYPDLKASANFQELQHTLADIEDQIQMARRYYNGAVRELNILVDSFPSNLVASRYDFKKAVYFEIEDPADKALPKVEF
jgi:LemA protein